MQALAEPLYGQLAALRAELVFHSAVIDRRYRGRWVRRGDRPFRTPTHGQFQ
jgi:hypothetical protein